MLNYTEQKQVYECFKFLKKLYPLLSTTDDPEIILKGNENFISIIYPSNEFYYLTGELIGNNDILKWLYQNTVKINIFDFWCATKALKKNVISIIEDDFSLNFNYTNSDGQDVVFKFKKISYEIDETFNTIIKNIPNEAEINDDFFSDEFCEIYHENFKLLGERTETAEKIIQIPTVKILSLVKPSKVDSTRNYIMYEDKLSDASSYVVIKSDSQLEDMNLKLYQLFKTV